MRCRVLASLERAPHLRSGIRTLAVIAPFPPLPKSVTGPPMRSLDDIFEEYDFLDGDDRYRLLIEPGRTLEPMPDALKTNATPGDRKSVVEGKHGDRRVGLGGRRIIKKKIYKE